MDRRLSFMERGSEFLCDGCPNDLGNQCAWEINGFPNVKNTCTKQSIPFEEKLKLMTTKDANGVKGTIISLPERRETKQTPAILTPQTKPEVEFKVFSEKNVAKMVRYAYLP